MKKILVIIIVLFLGLISLKAQTTLTVGKTVQNIVLKDLNNKNTTIPGFGIKPVVIVYTDPDVRDYGDPLVDAILTKDYNKKIYSGVGIVNSADSWFPNYLILIGAKIKAKKYPDSAILIDDNKLLEKTWGLGNCDEISIFIIIDKNKKVVYLKKIESENESKALVPEVIKFIDKFSKSL